MPTTNNLLIINNQECLVNSLGKTTVMRPFINRPLQCFELEDLVRETRLPQEKVIAYIESLIAEGVKIGICDVREYFYEPKEYMWHPDCIAAHLCSQWWGQKILVGDTLTSTIEIAKSLPPAERPPGTVVVANMQTEGRGRRGNRWVSRKGKDILVSFFVKSEGWRPSPSLVSLYATTAVARVLDSAYHVPVTIKWPNDLYVHGSKLGGLLVEWLDDYQGYLISMGLNVHSRSSDWPSLRDEAISLDMIQKEDWQRDLLLAQCGITWEGMWHGMSRDRGETVRGYWKRYSSTLSQRVDLYYRGKKCVGFIQGIDELGRLILIEDNGEKLNLLPEEVQMLRVVE